MNDFDNSTENEYIFSFNDLKIKLEKVKQQMENSEDEDFSIVKTYVCLAWLGLTPEEIKNAVASDYNQAVKALVINEKVIFINEKEIADLLLENVSSCNSSDKIIRSKSCSDNAWICLDAEKTAEKYGLGYKFVYKMCFFNEKYTLKQSGQPADLVKFKDMVKIIDINIDVLLKEFDDYEKCRNSLTANTK